MSGLSLGDMVMAEIILSGALHRDDDEPGVAGPVGPQGPAGVQGPLGVDLDDT